MNRTLFKTLGAAVATLSLAFGGVKAAESKVEKESRRTLESMLVSVNQIRTEADQLVGFTKNSLADRQLHAAQMEMIKSNFDMVNRNLQALDRERPSLAPWEVQALEQVVPLLKDAADADTKAIQYFNENPLNLTALSYRNYAEQIYDDASRADAKLGESLKLAKLRHEVAHVTAEMSGGAE